MKGQRQVETAAAALRGAASVFAMSRAILRAPSWIERGIFRVGAFGRVRGGRDAGNEAACMRLPLTSSPTPKAMLRIISRRAEPQSSPMGVFM